MSAQSIAIAVGIGALGVAEYRERKAQAGGDWLFGAVITFGLVATFLIAILRA
jgi:hypothetical protein